MISTTIVIIFCVYYLVHLLVVLEMMSARIVKTKREFWELLIPGRPIFIGIVLLAKQFKALIKDVQEGYNSLK